MGFLQRTSVYWPTNHEAGEHSPGVAALRGNTAYRVPLHKTRPEDPADEPSGRPARSHHLGGAEYLARLREDIEELRKRPMSWSPRITGDCTRRCCEYMTEIAHAAIDAGADVVIGHGPHYSLPVEVYKGKPIFYGLGSFSFHTGHGGRKHGNWVGMLARDVVEGAKRKPLSSSCATTKPTRPTSAIPRRKARR